MTTQPAGDFDYECHGAGYAWRRRTDPRLAGYPPELMTAERRRYPALRRICEILGVGLLRLVVAEP